MYNMDWVKKDKETEQKTSPKMTLLLVCVYVNAFDY